MSSEAWCGKQSRCPVDSKCESILAIFPETRLTPSVMAKGNNSHKREKKKPKKDKPKPAPATSSRGS